MIRSLKERDIKGQGIGFPLKGLVIYPFYYIIQSYVTITLFYRCNLGFLFVLNILHNYFNSGHTLT